PLRYASNNRGTEKSPPMATRPSLEALAGSGKRKRRSSRRDVGDLMVMRPPESRRASVPLRRLFHTQRREQFGLEQAAHFHRDQVARVGFVDFRFVAVLRFAQREPTAHAHV